MSGIEFSNRGLARLHRVLEGYVERAEVPGLVALAGRRGEVHVEAIGNQALSAEEPMRRDTIFRIASMTKPVTAVAAMILVEECKLRLDEPVDQLLPELANRRVLKQIDGELDETVPAARSITLRDLLTFRWGFGVVMAPPGIIQKSAVSKGIRMGPPRPQEQPPPDEWMRGLGTLPLMCQPGERWLYDTGSDVLGVLISRASGRSLETFFRERIFDPLGMKDTAFSVTGSKTGRFATSYWTKPGSDALEVYDKADGGEWNRPPAFEAGAAGLVSTVDDFLAFSQMLLKQGKFGSERILSRASVELMTADHLTPRQKAISGLTPGYFDSHGWGFGASVITKREDVAGAAGTFGWNGGLGTSWNADPREEMTCILLTQRAWTSPNPPQVFLDFWTSAYAAVND